MEQKSLEKSTSPSSDQRKQVQELINSTTHDQAFPTDDTCMLRKFNGVDGAHRLTAGIDQPLRTMQPRGAATLPLVYSSAPLISIPYEQSLDAYSSLAVKVNMQQSYWNLPYKIHATPTASRLMVIDRRDPTNATGKRKMSWEDNGNAPHRQRNSTSFTWGINGGPSYSTFHPPSQRYTLYDQRYEEQGVPVDPHIRIFTATD